MATYGKIKAFSPASGDWTLYEEKLQFYFVANSIPDANKKSILLSVCGDPTFKLLRSLVPDGNLQADAVTYTSLVDLLKGHYGQKQSTIVHRFHFNCHSRKAGESVTDYVAALRELAVDCKYGAQLEEMLRDRLVCGVNHQGIQRRLLFSAEADLTYSNALKLAKTVEASERDAKKLGGEDSKKPPVTQNREELPNNYTAAGRGSDRGNRPKISCYRCGGPHLAPQCKHKDVICNNLTCWI